MVWTPPSVSSMTVTNLLPEAFQHGPECSGQSRCQPASSAQQLSPGRVAASRGHSSSQGRTQLKADTGQQFSGTVPVEG